MAYEASEICTAAALMFTTDELKKLQVGFNSNKLDRDDLVEKLEEAKSLMKIGSPKAKVGQVVFADGSQEQGFMKILDSSNDKILSDFAVGISAALGIRGFARKKGDNQPTKKVFMTGSKWPSEIEKFSLPEGGGYQYNSADIMVENNSAKARVKKYYGISLKKKSTQKATPPPLINKAFDRLIEGDSTFNKLMKDVDEFKYKFFADRLKQAITNKIIKIKGFSLPSNNKEIFYKTIKHPYKTGNIKLIDLKGEGVIKNNFDIKKAADKILIQKLFAKNKDGSGDLPNTQWKLRKFMNESLYGGSKSKYWQGVLKLMNEYAEKFAEGLIDVILKVNLFNKLKKKDIDEAEFDFQLTTGVGNVTSKGNVTVGNSVDFQVNTLLCGYHRIEKKMKGKKWEIVMRDESVKGDSVEEAAKIKMWLKRGNVKIFNLELRYKGAFGSQPQFTGTLHPEFKELLEKECT